MLIQSRQVDLTVHHELHFLPNIHPHRPYQAVIKILWGERSELTEYSEAVWDDYIQEKVSRKLVMRVKSIYHG